MKVVGFVFSAKWGHFLRAEANSNGLTYPIPPRTVLLGLVGALLGLSKDEPQTRLAEASLAIAGKLPQRFWHKTNVRKDPPAPVPWIVKRSSKGSEKDQRNFRFPQEWLWKPWYRVWAALPDPYHDDLVERLRERCWHFTPCMGLSEMLADVNYLDEFSAESLPEDTHRVSSVVRQSAGRVDMTTAFGEELAFHSLRMPRSLTADRVFQHETYLAERDGRNLPFETGEAWIVGEEKVVFL